MDDYEKFIYKWQDEGICRFGWTKRTLYAIGVSKAVMTSTSGDINNSATLADE